MSIFEDTVEVWHNASERVEGPREIDTLIQGLQRVAHYHDDVAIVLDWESCHEISAKVDAHVPIPDDALDEHVELTTKRIGRTLGTKATIHGTESNTSFGLILHPIGVNYANEVISPQSVVAVDFYEV